MQTRVQKWGNCLIVRIPRSLAEQIGLGAGSEDSLSTKNGELVVKPALPTSFWQRCHIAISIHLLKRARLWERRSSNVYGVCI
jgi:antitoxin component of MazEF toxin-antitoxin module